MKIGWHLGGRWSEAPFPNAPCMNYVQYEERVYSVRRGCEVPGEAVQYEERVCSNRTVTSTERGEGMQCEERVWSTTRVTSFLHAAQSLYRVKCHNVCHKYRNKVERMYRCTILSILKDPETLTLGHFQQAFNFSFMLSF